MKLFTFILIFFSSTGIFANILCQQNDVNIYAENVNDNYEEKAIQPDKRSIYGKIYIGENPLPEGSIYLFDTQSSAGFCKNTYVNNGIFRFNNLNQGYYRLFVIPDQNYNFNFYPKYLPTYFRNTYKWEKSNDIKVTTADVIVDIDLISYSDPFYGDMSISGELLFSTSSMAYSNCPVPIFLLNSNKEPMDFRIVNRNSGDYRFDHLPEGSYYIYPEYPGLFTEAHLVSLNTNYISDMRMNFFAENDEIKLQAPQEDEIISTICQNCLKIYISNHIKEPVVCELYNIAGAAVIKNVYKKNEIVMNTSNLTAGIYILRIKTYTNSFIETKKVYINNY